MKKQEALSVGEIIDMAMTQTGNKNEYMLQQACFLWTEVVGANISKFTTRRWIDGNNLHVCIASAAIKSELSFVRDRLAANINNILGQNIINEVIIH